MQNNALPLTGVVTVVDKTMLKSWVSVFATLYLSLWITPWTKYWNFTYNSSLWETMWGISIDQPGGGSGHPGNHWSAWKTFPHLKSFVLPVITYGDETGYYGSTVTGSYRACDAFNISEGSQQKLIHPSENWENWSRVARRVRWMRLVYPNHKYQKT